jgi:hypothetical protein
MFEDTVRFLGLTTRNNKKKVTQERGQDAFVYTDRYKVACVVGWNTIYFFRIENKELKQETERVMKTEGIIRRCFKDEAAYTGIYMLMSD